MAVLRIANTYDPRKIPAQAAFRKSNADILGYGGSLGGGKTRTLCETAFDWMLEFPGILIPIFRQVHTDITLSTRLTFIDQVLPPEMRHRTDLVKTKQSAGEDYVKLWNGSSVHFVGLDRPGKVFGTEFGAAMFDEAHEISAEDVTTVNSRLRQRCRACIKSNSGDCTHMPRRMVFAFNPSYPGHWLQEWFMLGATQTELGFRKDELFIAESETSLGSVEFFRSRAQENPFLPPGYIERNLAGMQPWKKRRLLDGKWEHQGGSFFDDEALSLIEETTRLNPPLMIAEPIGDTTGVDKDDRPRLVERKNGGRLNVYKAPVRWHVTNDGDEIKSHRYVVSVDASSGTAADYSAIQVIDVEELEQVAEWQGKIDPDKLAEHAFLLACVYNGATLAPEITGGWGFAVVKRCQAMIGQWKGPAHSKPKLYTRPVLDRLSDRFTDRIGWDTNTKSRAQMLDILEESLRDGSLTIHSPRTHAELSAFATPDRIGDVGDYRSPRAQKGAHDDLVIALAIGVAIAVKLPKNTRMRPQPNYEPEFQATGY